MKTFLTLSVVSILTVFLACATAPSVCAQSSYVATNDDNPNGNTTSVYYWDGSTLAQIPGSPFPTGGYGLGGGYFAIPRNAISVDKEGKCMFVGDAYNNGFTASDIAAFAAYGGGVHLVGDYTSANSYSGAQDGVGLAVSADTLIVNYTASDVLEEWTIGDGCTLTETGNTVSGLGGNGGVADGLVTSYGCFFFSGVDGTVVSGTINPFAQVGTYTAGGYTKYSGVPAGLHIHRGILFADDAGGTQALFDSWKINADCSLGRNVTSGPLRGTIYGSNTFNISPNGKYIYTIGTFSGTVQTDEIRGQSVVNTRCPDQNLLGYGDTWIYPGEGGLQNNERGNGGWQFLAEGSFGLSNNSYIGVNAISARGCLTNTQKRDARGTVDGTYPDSSIYLLSLETPQYCGKGGCGGPPAPVKGKPALDVKNK